MDIKISKKQPNFTPKGTRERTNPMLVEAKDQSRNKD